MVTDTSDQPPEQEKKLKNLEQELNDLRQGLAVVTDYYQDLETASRKQDAVEAVDLEITRQLVDDEREFEGIWRFHEEMLIGDVDARVPFEYMYDAFVNFCKKNGRMPVDVEAFAFVFARMENPAPEMDRGEWIGCRIKTDGA
jgi:hypothetical protein